MELKFSTQFSEESGSGPGGLSLRMPADRKGRPAMMKAEIPGWKLKLLGVLSLMRACPACEGPEPSQETPPQETKAKQGPKTKSSSKVGRSAWSSWESRQRLRSSQWSDCHSFRGQCGFLTNSKAHGNADQADRDQRQEVTAKGDTGVKGQQQSTSSRLYSGLRKAL